MKVVHISTTDNQGGAAKAAFRLHSAMLQDKIESRMLVLKKLNESEPEVFELRRRKRHFWNHLFYFYDKFKLRKLTPSYPFSIGSKGFDISNHPLVRNADVIYLHWINHDMLNLRNIKQLLSLNKDVYWFMHDMWPITGGCHHSFDCKRYTAHCGSCVCVGSKKEKDISYKVHDLKLSYFSAYSNLHAIVPSLWLANCCRESSLFKNREINIVPNVLDTNLYKPIDKSIARKVFNFPENKKLILFGAEYGAKNLHKGWGYLETTLKNLRLKDCEVVVFGKGDSSVISESPYLVHFMGYLHDDVSLMMLYNAVDVFLSPSLAESFGQTIAEAMACGLPVVAFNVGGVPGLITHKETGYLAKFKDADDLVEGIEWCVESENAKKVSEAAPRFIENYCSYHQGVKLHKKILGCHLFQ